MNAPKDYKDTLNLPKTDFPMKANLEKREPEFLKKWEEEKLYQNIIQKNKGKPTFILHDGPPYANSPIHIGTALNKILKDIVVRYKNMSGFLSEYVPGWDCHGLPIELQATQKLGGKKKVLSPLEIRRLCRDHANTYIDIQRKQFKRLGVMGEWETPYITMSFDYEAQIVRELATLASKGFLYKGKKAIHWCASCQTALAEAEIEYAQKTSPSIYVKFALTQESLKKLAPKIPPLKGRPLFVLIWTTTPWTLPSNIAIALHPEFTYLMVSVQDEVYILAKSLLDSVQTECGLKNAKVLAHIQASELSFLKCKHPFLDKESIILLSDHVTEESGTGCVHTAPGHGADDYYLGVKHHLDIFSPVDSQGRFTSEMPDYQGEFVFDTNPLIIKRLLKEGALLKESSLTHSYPHCWRCRQPLLFRATEQWFILIDKPTPGAPIQGSLTSEALTLRKEALKFIRGVKWIPSWGQRRIESMMESRPDWCISRQRSWGVPIPALQCKQCLYILSDPVFMNKIADHFEKEGGDFWFKTEAKDLLPSHTKCPRCGSAEFEKEKDVLDVWFDSGCSFAAVVNKRKNLKFPADLYLEGSDQHRGWFHTSLLVSAATRQSPPYKAVLTHGFVVDGEGRKMSKSLGNVVEPEKVIQQHGAEILRLWVASENYQNDIPCSEELLKRCSEVYRKIRNTCKFMLGNLSDFDPDNDRIPYKDLLEIDQYALLKAQLFIEKSAKAYDTYEFQNFFYALNNYCVVDLSSFYLDILKDRLYTFGEKSHERLSAQTVLYDILFSLTKVIAPILIFTSEEIYQSLPAGTKQKEKSIHLTDWPLLEYSNKALEEKWETLLKLREMVLKALEEARQRKVIGNSLEAKVLLQMPLSWQKIFDATPIPTHGIDFSQLFIVSQVDIQKNVAGIEKPHVSVQKSDGQKCPRCWVWSQSITPSQPICDKCEKAVSTL